MVQFHPVSFLNYFQGKNQKGPWKGETKIKHFMPILFFTPWTQYLLKLEVRTQVLAWYLPQERWAWRSCCRRSLSHEYCMRELIAKSTWELWQQYAEPEQSSLWGNGCMSPHTGMLWNSDERAKSLFPQDWKMWHREVISDELYCDTAPKFFTVWIWNRMVIESLLKE